ncbi:MAG: 50S ribosomal protein L21 [bacterium]|nr:50S ribosomal protein L21 [bacterium]
MKAVVEIKGKQYHIGAGQIIRTLRVDGEPGDLISPVRVLATIDGDNVSIGKPALDGIAVSFEIVRHAKAPKIKIFKYKAKGHYSRRMGYRDKISYLRVKEIG